VREDLVAMSITIFGCASERCGAQFPRPGGTKVLARLVVCMARTMGLYLVTTGGYTIGYRWQPEAPNEIKSVCY